MNIQACVAILTEILTENYAMKVVEGSLEARFRVLTFEMNKLWFLFVLSISQASKATFMQMLAWKSFIKVVQGLLEMSVRVIPSEMNNIWFLFLLRIWNLNNHIWASRSESYFYANVDLELCYKSGWKLARSLC